MAQNDVFNSMESRRAKVAQVQENSARPGRVLSSYTATGLGTVIEPQCFTFGAAFTDKPHFSFGSEILTDITSVPQQPPLCIASVYRWRQLANGLYTGAYCTFYVGSLVSGLGSYEVEFHLTFEGILIKHFIASLGFPVQDLDI
jgi:hypothetical protein